MDHEGEGAALPPVPEERHISPDPAFYAARASLRALAWPLLWIGLALALGAFLRGQGWPAFDGGHGHGHGAASHHASPS